MDLDLTEYVQRRIFYGSFEPAEARLLRRLLRPGDRVLDVGANVGYFTLIAARAVGPSGAVVAVEPVEANADALDHNVQVNGFTNVTLRRVAVDAVDGTLEVGLVDDPFAREHGRDATSGHYTVGGALLSRTVPSVTLDSLAADLSPDRPVRLVKIDVEGWEDYVLAGGTHLFTEVRPDYVAIEVSSKAAPARLETMGYVRVRLGADGRIVEDRAGPLELRAPGLNRLPSVENLWYAAAEKFAI